MADCNLDYCIMDDKGEKFDKIIELPDDYKSFSIIIKIPASSILDRQSQEKVFTNQAPDTEFDRETIQPILREIWSSQNLDCKIDRNQYKKEGTYIVSVFRRENKKYF